MRHSNFVSLLLCACVLTACGGGGGGGGGGGTSPGRGSFTLSGTSASFSAVQGAIGQPQQFAIHITGSDVAALGAAYAPGQTPAAWLSVDIQGSGSNYQLILQPIAGMVAPGDWSASFTVGTADSSGAILKTQVFNVTYHLDAAMTIDTAFVQKQYQFGDASRVETIPVTVTANNRQWTAQSDAPWLQVPSTAQSGSLVLNATIDVTGLAPGTYNGRIQLTNSAVPLDTQAVNVAIIIAPAVLSVAQTNVLFGGDDGRATLAAVPINLSLNTAQGIHPFAAAVTTDSGGAWLTLDHPAGTVGSAGSTLMLNVQRGTLAAGTYTGQLSLSTTVYGTVFTRLVPVTLNIEANRIFTNASGIGLSSIAGRNVLTRTLKVFSSMGNTSTPWTASDDASWLTVTSSGTTGGDLVLTATPGAMALDTVHHATVTVTSSDPLVENTQTIRVGLYLSNTAPASVNITGAATHLSTNPVEPVVAISAGGVSLYQVYTGALIRDIPGAAAQAGALAWSGDGRTLYVFDVTNRVVNAVDPSNGLVLRTFDSQPIPQLGQLGGAMRVFHPNGYELLVTPSARTYDLATDTQYSQVYNSTNTPFAVFNSLSLHESPDQSMLISHYGWNTKIVRTALNGGGLVISMGTGANTAGGRDGEACVSAAGDRIYTASGAPYNYPATSIATGQVIQVLPGDAYPAAVQCVWNGIVIGGSQSYYADSDIYVYNGVSGVLLGKLSSNGVPTGAYRDLVERGLAVSADGTRLMSSWSGNGQRGVYFHTLPPP